MFKAHSSTPDAPSSTLHAIKSALPDSAFFLRSFDDRQSVGVWLSKADAERLRDYLVREFPIEPVAVERGLFEERKPAARKFKRGDRVQINAPGAYSGIAATRGTGTVTGHGPDGRVRVNVDPHAGEPGVSMQYLGYFERELSPLVEAPKFKVGDYVRMVEPYGFSDRVGDVWRVTGTRKFAGEDYIVGTRLRDGAADYDRKASRFELTEKPRDPLGSVEGVELWVTGDTAGRFHGIPTGTKVEAVRRNAFGDHLLLVKGAGREAWVHENDLTIDEPFVPVPVGTIVRITNDGAATGLRHYLTVGSLAEVTGSRPGYTLVRGASRHGAHTTTQELKAASFEVVK